MIYRCIIQYNDNIHNIYLIYIIYTHVFSCLMSCGDSPGLTKSRLKQSPCFYAGSLRSLVECFFLLCLATCLEVMSAFLWMHLEKRQKSFFWQAESDNTNCDFASTQ